MLEFLADFSSSPYFWLVFYGTMLLVVIFIAAASDDDTLLRLQAIALTHWLAYVIVTMLLGFGNAVLIVSMSCAAAIWSAWVGYRARSRAALAVVLLWIAAAAWSTWFYYVRDQGAYLHYLGLNISFIARMLVVGVVGVVVLVGRLGPVPHWAVPRRAGR